VGKVETRGREKRVRRALTDAEVGRLLDVAADRRIVYLTALLTGLRRTELSSLRWGDVHLDAVRPFLTVRASTTKNHLAATMFLRDDLATELRTLRPAGADDGALVFGHAVPVMEVFRADLAAAGIAYKDSQKRQADFHALRHTLATNLARFGVQPRVAMELMRHSDMRLTNKTYTDAGLLPMVDALDKLPRYGVAVEVLAATGTDEVCKIAAQTAAQLGVRLGHGMSQLGTETAAADGVQVLGNAGDSRPESGEVMACHSDGESSASRTRTYNIPVNSRMLYH